MLNLRIAAKSLLVAAIVTALYANFSTYKVTDIELVSSHDIEGYYPFGTEVGIDGERITAYGETARFWGCKDRPAFMFKVYTSTNVFGFQRSWARI